MPRKAPFNLVRFDIPYPGYEGYWVRVRDDITVDELEALDRPGNWKVVREILANYIEDWNLRDKAGRKLPRPFKKPEVLGRLPLRLFLWCASIVGEAATKGLPFPEEEEDLSASESGRPSPAETSAGPQRNLDEASQEKPSNSG